MRGRLSIIFGLNFVSGELHLECNYAPVCLMLLNKIIKKIHFVELWDFMRRDSNGNIIYLTKHGMSVRFYLLPLHCFPNFSESQIKKGLCFCNHKRASVSATTNRTHFLMWRMMSAGLIKMNKYYLTHFLQHKLGICYLMYTYF